MLFGDTRYYSVRITIKEGSTVNAGSMITSLREAEWLAAEMGALLGVKPAAQKGRKQAKS